MKLPTRLLVLAGLIVPLHAWSADFPLHLTLPPDFANATRTINEGLGERENFNVYCTEADAKLRRAQLFGQRAEEKLTKGCFVVERDRSSTYDTGSSRFSAEKDIETVRAMGSSKGSSTSPRYEVKVEGPVKRQIKGLPALYHLQQLTSDWGTERIHFLHVAASDGVWLVTFAEGGDAHAAAAIWQAFLAGL